MIQFKAITEDHFDDIIHMKRPDGEQFVAPNSISLAQAWLYRDAGDVHPFAICAEEQVVGFMMLEDDDEVPDLILWRMMIAVEHEGKGYGTDAVRLLIRLARESGEYEGINLICHPENQIARHIYDKLGFVPTGKILYGDVELRLVL